MDEELSQEMFDRIDQQMLDRFNRTSMNMDWFDQLACDERYEQHPDNPDAIRVTGPSGVRVYDKASGRLLSDEAESPVK